MRSTGHKLTVMLGVFTLVLAFIRAASTAFQMLDILGRDGAHLSWTYYVNVGTGVLGEILVGVAIIVIGSALPSRDEPYSEMATILPPQSSYDPKQGPGYRGP